MPRFAANLTLLFNEVDFLDRFEAAADAGFRGVEFLFPYEYPAEVIRERLDAHGLEMALFNFFPGDWAGGERGFAAVPGREADFRAALDRAVEYARVLRCPTVHAMAGIVDANAEGARETYVSNLRLAADRAGEEGRTIVIEPLNSRDVPGYFLSRTDQAAAVIEEVARDNVRLQLDLYHCQIMEGNLAMHIRALAPRAGHIQIAGVPERHEPDIGEINYPYLFEVMDEVGYGGWVGCEYNPRAGTTAGLGWLDAVNGR